MRLVRHSGFVLLSSFDIRVSSLPILFNLPAKSLDLFTR
jgi:hypothetical protein